MIVALVPGPGDSTRVWSGSSWHLLEALRRANALHAALDSRPPAADAIEKIASFSPDRQRWRQRFAARSSVVSPLARLAWRRRARNELRALTSSPDAVLQIGGWVDAGPVVPGALRASYHDGNLAVYRQHPRFALDTTSRGFRRAWDFERRLYDGMDVIFTMSDWVRDGFVDDFEQDPAKVVTVGAGANLVDLPDPPATRDFSSPRILFIGKGDFARKGGPELLEAFAMLRAERPDAELWLVGPEPGAAAPGVTWFGLISKGTPEGRAQIDRLYREATLFAMPSVYEAFGIVFLEAMAYALPCIGARSCAMPEIVRDGETGRIVPPGDPASLAAALSELASDPERCRRLGAAGRERFLERYTWDRVAGRIVEEIALRRASGRNA
jgi:glycosyltransferase involved in cell wall biosynthesis